MKCDICGQKVDEHFLQKVIGTFMKNKKGKKKLICANCQQSHSKEELLEKI